MKLNFSSLAPLALLSSAVLAPLALAQKPQADSTPSPNIPFAPVNLTPPDDVKVGARTIVTGLADLQEEALPAMFGVQDDTTLYMKSMIGITDSIYEITNGVYDAARLVRHDNLDDRDAIVSVGFKHGLAVHYIHAGSGVVHTTVLDPAATTAMHVATGDMNNDGRDDIVVADGNVVTVYSGNSPFLPMASFTSSSTVTDLVTLNWNHASKKQVLLQYPNGFEILNYTGVSLNVVDSRFGATITSFYTRLKNSAPTGRDELGWVLDHPNLGWISLTLWHLPGGQWGSSPAGMLDPSWNITGMSSGDLNGDGLDDLALSMPNSDLARLLTYTTGSGVAPFSHTSGTSHTIFTGNIGTADQSPFAIGDFDDNGQADMVVATFSESSDQTVAFDNVTTAIAQASGLGTTANFMTEVWEYQYTLQTTADEDDFILEEPISANTPIVNNDLRFLANMTLSEASAKLEVALFAQKNKNLRVIGDAIAYRTDLEHQGGSLGGFDLDYRMSFDKFAGGLLGGDWLGSQRQLFLFARPGRLQGASGHRPPLVIGYRMPESWSGTGNQFAVHDPSITSPADAAFWGANNLSDLPVSPYFGASCPAPTAAMALAPIGGVLPIKRIILPTNTNVNLGTPACVPSQF